MPRFRAEFTVPASGLPVELTDAGHAVWQTQRATDWWATRHAVTVGDQPGPATRHHVAVISWAMANGWTRPVGGSSQHPDWPRLRGANVPTHNGASVRERLQAMETSP